MKLYLHIPCFWILIACNMGDVNEVEEEVAIDAAVITGKCCIPGKMHKSIMYYGSTKEAPSAASELFYDEQERLIEAFTVSNASPVDGTRLMRREYNHRGLLHWTRFYDIMDDQKAVPRIFTEFLYDSLDRQYSHITHYPRQGNSQQSVFRYYNDEGKLIIIGGPDPDEGERMIYEYEGDKIKYRIRSLGGDDIYAGYLYIYNDEGHLVAEEFFRNARINFPGEGEGIFKDYVYDSHGRLSQERVYDPYWGFPMIYILEYIYWEEAVK